jgi:hypothetical protein
MDNATRRIRARFDAVRGLLDLARRAAPPLAPLVRALAAELGAHEARFGLTMGPLIASGLAAPGGRAAAECARVLAAADFGGAADRLVARLRAALAAEGEPRRGRPRAGAAPAAAPGAPPGAAPGTPPGAAPGAPPGAAKGAGAPAAVRAELARALEGYQEGFPRGERGLERAPPSAEGGPPGYERCPACGGGTSPDAARSELQCLDPECGAIRELVGTVFDGSQFYSQEGQKAKSGAFNPNRYYEYWITRIQALESDEVLGDRADPENTQGEKLLETLRKMVRRDRAILRLLDLYQVREMLSEIGRADLNRNIPLILKKLTGVGPPPHPAEVLVRAAVLFSKAIEVSERIRPSDLDNRKYYPSYIFRILDHLLPPDDHKSRRIFYYIYVQGADTVAVNDAEWALICEELPELTYRPTDRHLYLRYRPD